MATASKSFTATGNGTQLLVRSGALFSYAITGTFVGTVILERTRDGGITWEVLATKTAPASATLLCETPDGGPAVHRFRCSAYTSGTIVTTLSDSSDVLTRSRNGDGSDSVLIRSGGIVESPNAHLQLNAGVTSSDINGQTVRLNSIVNTGTTKDFIGFQSKPRQGATTTKEVIGGEVEPGVNDGFGAGQLTGLKISAYLKGTTGNIAADVRGLNSELVTDDAGARTIAGDVCHRRIRTCFSGTVTGKVVVDKIEVPEIQTGWKNFDAVWMFVSTNGSIWNVKGSDYTPAEPRAKVKILINGTAYWLVAYAQEPT